MSHAFGATTMTTTSLEALAYVTASGRLSTQRTLVAKAVASHPGLTASELDAGLGIGPVSVRRRLSDLKKEALVIRGEPRRAKGQVVREATWWPREQQGALL